MQQTPSKPQQRQTQRSCALTTRAIIVAALFTGATSVGLSILLAVLSDGTRLNTLLSAGLVAVVTGLGMAGVAAMLLHLLRPIQHLAEAAKRIAKKTSGDQDTMRGEIEVEELASSLNRIADRPDDAIQVGETLVEKRTRQLEEANAQLVRASEMKSEFLANMSHEIRTPLNGIIGFTDLLSDEDLTQEQAEYVKTISQCSGTLLTLVNDILDLSKVESGRLTIEKTDGTLTSLLKEVSASVEQRAMVKGVEYRVHVFTDVPARFRTDYGRLRQVLVNLVGNAVKFTPEGSVEIHVTLEEQPPASLKNRQETPWLSFLVADTGIGIPPDRLRAVFDPFVQADGSTTRQFGGTGLGLAISKRLMELLGGTIEVTSKPGKGSQFRAVLPYEPAETSETTPEEPTEEPENTITCPFSRDELPATVLLIEDDDRSAAAMATSLARHGITVYRHHRRHGCEELCAALMPDAIILDLALPDGTGLEVLEGLKANEATADIPVVVCSGCPDDGQARQRGATQFLQKPVTDIVLLQALREARREDGLPPSPPTSAPTGANRKASPADPATKGARILLVEDVLENRRLIHRILEKMGYSVTEAVNGQDALEQLKGSEERPNLILMDMQMPVMSGYEATTRIKSDPLWREIPVIALTANAMTGDREKCISAGCDDYLTKPVKRAALDQMLTQHLRNASGKTPQPSMP